MTTNDKTLADVQPGGRVRLGGAPWPEIDVILADAYSAGAEGLPFEGIARRAAVRKAIAALSAQPSPGGQDVRELLAAEFDKNEVTAAAARRLRNHNETAVEAAALRVIAARQPVEAAPQGCDACDRTGIRQNDEGRNICCPDCDLGRACAGDTRQPVGEPEPYVVGNQYFTQAGDLVRFVAVHNEGTSYECMEDEAGVNRYTRRDFGRVTGSAHDYSDPRNTPPLYAVPPTQAVDLDELRRAVCVVGVVGQIDGHDVVRRNSVLDVIDTRRQRLTESKVVGNDR